MAKSENNYADSILTINLSAIKDNYMHLKSRLNESDSRTKLASVVKANAYGLGAINIAPILKEAGCEDFFVANLDEAISLRKIIDTANIYVFHGIQKNQENIFVENNITPVINNLHQLNIWQNATKKRNERLKTILHFDSGMNRLGMSLEDAQKIIEQKITNDLDIKYIMSHLACADEKEHKQNQEQLDYFKQICRLLPKIKASFANSSGIFLGRDYHFDMARSGCALYGVNPTPALENPMKQVISLRSRILDIHVIDSRRAVGYGAACILPKGSKIATLPIGYADGFLRSLSNKGFCFVSGRKVPIIGRVSMDLITIDVSGVENINIGDEVEIIGDNILLDQTGWNYRV